MAGRGLPPLTLSEDERAALEALAGRRKTSQAAAMRARIVLAASEGAQNKDIAIRLGISPPTVGKWRRRFVDARLDGLRDEPRPGAPRTIAPKSSAAPDISGYPETDVLRRYGYEDDEISAMKPARK